MASSSSSSSSTVVAYKYWMVQHLALCHGPVDKILMVAFDDKTLWCGDLADGQKSSVSGDTSRNTTRPDGATSYSTDASQNPGAWISLNNTKLFSSDLSTTGDVDDGISGTALVMFGGPNQPESKYLKAALGVDRIPAFRGVTTVVLGGGWVWGFADLVAEFAGSFLNGCYVGNSVSLRKPTFRLQRIHVRGRKGLAQWYDAKAAITALLTCDQTVGATWKYLKSTNSAADYHDYTDWSDYDDAGNWSEGAAPFCSSTSYNQVPSWCLTGSGTVVSLAGSSTYESLWIRRTFEIDTAVGGGEQLWVYCDDTFDIWINNKKIGANTTSGVPTDPLTTFTSKLAIPPNTLVNGTNYIVARVRNIGLTYSSPWYFDCKIVASTQDMNPAHIIRECLTDTDWGMGYTDDDIDNDSFESAADTLYSESMGISIKWAKTSTIETFVKDICNHIDASLFLDRATGKFKLVLIRDDYDEDDLITLSPSNVEKIESWAQAAFGDMINTVTVTYWNNATGKSGGVTVEDPALVQMQGCTVSQTNDYPGFSNAEVASRVAQRDLLTLSQPLVTATIVANNVANQLNIGSVFKFYWPEYLDETIVMRVTKIAFGDGKENRVKIVATQDIFSTPAEGFIKSSGGELTLASVSDSARATPAQMAAEATYLQLVLWSGQSTVDSLLSDDATQGRLMLAAAAPIKGSHLSCRAVIDSSGSGYDPDKYTTMGLCPFVVLSAAVTLTATTVYFSSGSKISDITAGTLALLGTEWVRIDAIDTDALSLTIGRGCLDSIPQTHSAGDTLLVCGVNCASDSVQYASAETVDVEFLTVTASDVLDESLASTAAVTMAQRALRPYVPGCFRVQSKSYPDSIEGTADVVFTWLHRDRTQQTVATDILDTTSASVGPESNVTYTLRLYDETGALVRTVTGLTGLSYTWSTESGDSNLVSGTTLTWTYGTAINSLQVLYSNSSSSTQTVNSSSKLVLYNASTFITIKLGQLPKLTNFDLSLVISATSATGWTTNTGITYRTADAGYNSSYTDSFAYLVDFSVTGAHAGKVEIGKGPNGANNSWTQLAISDVPLGYSDLPVTLRVVVNGSLHKVYVNDTLYISKTDATYPSAGNFGLWVYGGAYSWQISSLSVVNLDATNTRKNTFFTAKLKAVSSTHSLDSASEYSVTTQRSGYGYNYGKFYGGPAS